MKSNQARIIVSLQEGKFEISGSELFVSQQIENLKEIIKMPANEAAKAPRKKDERESIQKKEDLNPEDTKQNIGDLHPSIYALDNDKVNIICDIPGSSDSKKAQNVALLYAFAEKHQGKKESLVEEIRGICKIHGCFDQTNFSSHIKHGNPKLYIDKGSGKARVLIITKPGENKVIELIKSIESNG